MAGKMPRPLFVSLMLSYFTVFIDQLGYSFICPILPYFVEELNGTSFEMGILVGSYALTQAISAYLMGILSDKYGRRPFLIASLIGSFVGPLLQSISWNMTSFILFRGLTGLLAGSITLGQSIITDCFPVEERAKYMSQLCGMVSFAFVFGPAVGGFLAEWALRVPFYFAGGLALIILVLVVLFMNETLGPLKEKQQLKKEIKKYKKKTSYTTEESSQLEALEKKLKLIEEKNQGEQKTKEKIHWNTYMIVSLVARFFNEFSTIIIESMYGKFLMDTFNSAPMDFSLILCATGVASGAVQFFIFPYLHDKKHVSITTTSWIAGIFEMVGFACMAYVPYLWFSYLSCSLMYVGYGLITPLSPAILSAQTPPSIQGHAISIGVIVGQIAMVVAPPFLGAIYDIDKELTVLSGSVAGFIIFVCSVILACIPGGKTCDIVSYDDPKKEEKEGTEMNDSEKHEIEIALSKEDLDAIEKVQNEGVEESKESKVGIDCAEGTIVIDVEENVPIA